MTHTAWAPKPNISHSSMRTFDRCPRSWALRYARDLLPAELTARARDEARIAPTATLAGTVVDTVITDAMQRWKDGERPSALYPRAMAVLREILAYSREWAGAVLEGRYPPYGRFQPVEKAYSGEEWDTIEKDQVLSTIRTCLGNFETCGILDLIEGYPPETWVLPPEEGCPWFMLDAIPVYAKWDFAIRAETETIILDWKTGKKDTESVAVQLSLYGMYAMHEWGVRRQDVTVIPVWLATGDHEARWLSPIVCETVTAMVCGRYREIMDRLDAIHNGGSALDLFPMAESSRECASCCFRSCPGHGSCETAQKPQAPRIIPVTVEVAR